MGKARFPKGSDEAKEYMAMIRQMGNQNQMTNPPKARKAKKKRNLKKLLYLKQKKKKQLQANLKKNQNQFVKQLQPHQFHHHFFLKKPKPVAQLTKIEPEPAGVIEDIEPGVPAKKQKIEKESRQQRKNQLQLKFLLKK